MRDRMLAGDDFRADDPDLDADGARAAGLLARYDAELDPAGRRVLLAELLGALGPGSTIRSPFRCDFGSRISVGASCFVNWGAVFQDTGPITLGDGVLLGPNVQLLTAEHPLDPDRRRAGWQRAAPVVIGDNAWLGAGAIVLPGVTVGADAVVGAGAVVTRDVPPGVLVLGSPARVVRTLVPGAGG